ncbi:MAG: UTP--glucose-1-phosphate uridylyltransferase, partial [Opitutales bacterium]
MNSTDGTAVRSTFEREGQDHVFCFWDRLNSKERDHLLRQASQIDLNELRHAIDQALQPGECAAQPYADIEPAPCISLPLGEESRRQWEDAGVIGEELLSSGKVAAFTVAGGQGTRLGCEGPKGAFPITPVSQKSLFQLFAEKIKAANARYGGCMSWFVMTSTANHDQTKRFFAERDHFGLNAAKITFLCQGMMPAVLETGKILLASSSSIAMNPDGHGGSIRVLAKSGAAKKMQDEGIEVITYFQVDNPLAPFLEPSFLGFHFSAGSEMSSRAAPKNKPEEKVGVFCLRGESLTVIEYSDLPNELAQLRNKDGSLIFHAGNLAMHAINPSFVERIGTGGKASQLPFHAARKKVPTINEKGDPIIPDAPNAIKLETFVFDALPLARRTCVLE